MPTEYLLINAAGMIMGRLAAHVAKLALLGKHIVVINAKDIVISGNKESIFKEYIKKKNIKTRSNPHQGPFFYRTPDKLFRRTVRGMLPFKQNRGQEAYRRVHVFINDIDEDKKYPVLIPHAVPNIGYDRLKGKFITLETLSNRFGWTNLQ